MIDEVKRHEPPEDADERRMLEGWLDFHRNTLWNKCAGLSDEKLKERAVPPSSISLLGLVRHMTEVERGWFSSMIMTGELEPLYYKRVEGSWDDDFDKLDDTPAAEVFAKFESVCAESRDIMSGVASPDQHAMRPRRHKPGPVSARWIMVHMIEEYARHNGHADFLRERIDGTTGD